MHVFWFNDQCAEEEKVKQVALGSSDVRLKFAARRRQIGRAHV
jgi:hypothetical protein